MSAIFKGELLSGDSLESEYRDRRLTYISKTIDKELSIPEGWTLFRENKKTNRIRKEKPISQLLEDKLWKLFYDIGVGQISTADFTLVLREVKGEKKTKQLDVVAIDDDIVFVVECKSKEELGKKSLKKDIAEYGKNKTRIESALRNLLGRGKTFVHIFATENIEIDGNDKVDAEEEGVVFWDEYDVLALEELAKLAGEGAKYQIYNRIFHERKIKGFDLKIPALKSKMGGITYYSFLIHPADLLKIAYVHHRTGETSFMDLSSGYQRMIKHSKVKNIESFIKSGGFFPSSVIVNFKKNLLKEEDIGKKEHLAQMSDASKPVAITIPPYYGSAWVIDGQHRLYGYADVAEKERETLPVIAFVNLDGENEKRGSKESLEAKIFVDINKNQTSIPANLLWDLYEDLYPESEDSKEQLLYAISMIAKKLNDDSQSPFRGRIEIPKEQNQGEITLYTICNSIKSQQLVSPKNEDSLFRTNFEETIEFSANRIAYFFDVFREEMPAEWKAGEKHYFCTNAGVTVMMGILRDLLDGNITRTELRNLKSFRKAVRRFIDPILMHFMDIDQETINGYRGAGGAGQKSNQVRRELTNVIIDANVGFRSLWLERFENSPQDKDKFEKHKKGLDYYLEKEESDVLEFKASLSVDIDRLLLGDGKNKQNNDLINQGVLKSIVAFLNSKGGHVVVGVAEEDKYKKADEERISEYAAKHGKLLLGIDIEYSKDGWDGYQLRLTELIQNRIGSDVIDGEMIRFLALEHDEKTYCVIEVTPSEDRQYLNDSFYVRRANKTDRLKGAEVDRYWKLRQGK